MVIVPIEFAFFYRIVTKKEGKKIPEGKLLKMRPYNFAIFFFSF